MRALEVMWIAFATALFVQESFAFRSSQTSTRTMARPCMTQVPWTKSVFAPTLTIHSKKSELWFSSEGSTPEEAENEPPLLVKLASSPLGALLILALVVLFHESGHYLTARSLGVRVDEFSVGIGPKLLGFQAFGDQFSLRALPLGGYVSLNPAYMQALPALERIPIQSAGVAFNLLLAFCIYTGEIIAGKGLRVPVFDQGVVVSGLDKEAAAKGLLRPGDVIEAVNGKSLLTSPTSSEMEVQRAISKLIDEVQATPDGELVYFTVLDAKTSRVKNVEAKPKTVNQGKPSVGVFLVPNFVGVDLRKTSNPFEATAFAASHVAMLTTETAIGLVTFAGDLISGKASSSEYSISGPVKVVKRASEIVKTQDWDKVLNYVASISINLGLINFVPIPPTDGFQILFTVAESILKQTQT